MKAIYAYANGLVLAKIEGQDLGPAAQYFYHHDGLGSIIGMTDIQGSVVQSYHYDEFGRLLQEASPTGPYSNYKYTAQEYDGPISELYNYRARYYDSEIGRFSQEDPILGARITDGLGPCCRRRARTRGAEGGPGLPELQALSGYVYVTNNPINWIDPGGMSRYKKCEGIKNRFERWLCRWSVDKACGISFGSWTGCCRLDYLNCIEKIDADCPDDVAEKEAKKCAAEQLKCLARLKGKKNGK